MNFFIAVIAFVQLRTRDGLSGHASQCDESKYLMGYQHGSSYFQFFLSVGCIQLYDRPHQSLFPPQYSLGQQHSWWEQLVGGIS